MGAKMNTETQEIIDRIKVELCSMKVKFDAGKYGRIEDCYWIMRIALENRIKELKNQSHPEKTI